MKSITEILDNTFYPEYKKNWDNSIFRDFILERAIECKTALDLGAGAGIINYLNFKGLFQKVYGIDLDERVLQNPFLNEAKTGSVESLPYEDNSFDLVYSANVLEHLKEPCNVFNEVRRVLKPGGAFITKTPNKYHYVPLIAKCTPDIFHKKVNKLRGRQEDDTFPTYYRVNSISDQRNIAEKCGLIVKDILTVEARPEYMRIHFIPYLFGIMYERLVNINNVFSNFRVVILSHFKKP
jgi:ubiquinone/menaquinone biosynthesis C-methylase UbiE